MAAMAAEGVPAATRSVRVHLQAALGPGTSLHL